MSLLVAATRGKPRPYNVLRAAGQPKFFPWHNTKYNEIPGEFPFRGRKLIRGAVGHHVHPKRRNIVLPGIG